MDNILEYLDQNPWMNLIFLFLALISIIISVVLYIKSKKSRLPFYSIRSINLIKEKISKIKSVEILYEGNKVDNLTISKLAFWNSGKETIDANDVAKLNPVRIIPKHDKIILDSEILFTKNTSNNISIDLDKQQNRIDINFDYIDCGEGAVIQIYHTGIDSDDLTIQGDIKSTKGFQEIKYPRSVYRFTNLFGKNFTKRIPRKYLKYILGVAFIIAPLIASFALFQPTELPKTELPIWGKILMIGSVTIPYWWIGISILRSRIPKGFDIFEEDN